MYLQKKSVYIAGSNTAATTHVSTGLTGLLVEIGYRPSSNLPLSTQAVIQFYRTSTAMAANLIFKRGVPSTGAVWRPRHSLNLSTGEIVPSSNFGQPWSFADQKVKILLDQTSDANAKNGWIDLYIG